MTLYSWRIGLELYNKLIVKEWTGNSFPRKNRDTGELCTYNVVSATMVEEWLTKLGWLTDSVLLGE